MCLNKFAKALYTSGTFDEHTTITIYMYHDKERLVPLWSGEVKDLIDQKYLSDFIVVEMLVDHSSKFDDLLDRNKGKIITVI